MSKYVLPTAVNSPRAFFSLITVLDVGGEDTTALCLGRWENHPVLGIRWNGTADGPVGTPQSRGIATWFILPEGPITEAVIGTLPSDKQTLVRSIMGAA
jgi:hypothetical protein